MSTGVFVCLTVHKIIKKLQSDFDETLPLYRTGKRLDIPKQRNPVGKIVDGKFHRDNVTEDSVAYTR